MLFDNGWEMYLSLLRLLKYYETVDNLVLHSPLNLLCKGKGLPQQAMVAQGVPGRLRPWVFLMFSTMRVVGRQPYAPAAFTPGEIPGTYF